jgi:hypothetical protein
MQKFLIVICLAISVAGYSQCKNSIKLTRVEKNAGQGGVIEVAISSTNEFVCTLYTESGSGSKKVQDKKGYGTSSIRFDVQNANMIYLVQVEFLTEDDKHCRKLQKSEITFEAK